MSKRFNKVIEECQSRDMNVSLTWQKMTCWSIEIYIGYKDSYKGIFYIDGCINKKQACNKALKFFKDNK